MGRQSIMEVGQQHGITTLRQQVPDILTKTNIHKVLRRVRQWRFLALFIDETLIWTISYLRNRFPRDKDVHTKHPSNNLILIYCSARPQILIHFWKNIEADIANILNPSFPCQLFYVHPVLTEAFQVDPKLQQYGTKIVESCVCVHFV